MLRTFAFIVAAAFITAPALATVNVDLDDLSLAPESYYNGSDEAGGFTSHGVTFNNSYNTAWGSWSGFAYSNVTDNTTPGFGNQYSAYPGSGFGAGNDNYAIGYNGASLVLPVVTTVQSVRLSNTTYAALSMRDGDSFAKQFGGTTGDDADWFKLTITGLDALDQQTGAVDFYLADYRFDSNDQDYIVDSWELIDLTSLGSNVKSLSFSLSSSDVGAWGMNTPAYFALDNLNVATTPEPSTAMLVGLVALGAFVRRRRRNRV